MLSKILEHMLASPSKQGMAVIVKKKLGEHETPEEDNKIFEGDDGFSGHEEEPHHTDDIENMLKTLLGEHEEHETPEEESQESPELQKMEEELGTEKHDGESAAHEELKKHMEKMKMKYGR